MRPGELIHKVCSQTFAGAARIIRSILRMEFFFIIILAIAVFVVWLRNKDATSSQREDIARLEREIDFLKSQLGALVKAQAASLASAGPAAAPPETHAAPPRPKQPEAMPSPVPRQEPPLAAPRLPRSRQLQPTMPRRPRLRPSDPRRLRPLPYRLRPFRL